MHDPKTVAQNQNNPRRSESALGRERFLGNNQRRRRTHTRFPTTIIARAHHNAHTIGANKTCTTIPINRHHYSDAANNAFGKRPREKEKPGEARSAHRKLQHIHTHKQSACRNRGGGKNNSQNSSFAELQHSVVSFRHTDTQAQHTLAGRNEWGNEKFRVNSPSTTTTRTI